MNTEKLRFTLGDPPALQEPGDEYFCAQIHVIGNEVWLGRIAVYGLTVEDAEAMRARLLWSLQAPEAPDLWQYKSKHGELWHNCGDVGDAVKAKAEGYEIRALCIRRPLTEV